MWKLSEWLIYDQKEGWNIDKNKDLLKMKNKTKRTQEYELSWPRYVDNFFTLTISGLYFWFFKDKVVCYQNYWPFSSQITFSLSSKTLLVSATFSWKIICVFFGRNQKVIFCSNKEKLFVRPKSLRGIRSIRSLKKKSPFCCFLKQTKNFRFHRHVLSYENKYFAWQNSLLFNEKKLLFFFVFFFVRWEKKIIRKWSHNYIRTFLLFKKIKSYFHKINYRWF